tara:strand:+ start:690 stop:1100 length:411 start_codon:yes stop_codon:yes gene_type:complete
MKLNKNENFLSKKCVPVNDTKWKTIKQGLHIAMVIRKDAVGIASNQLGYNHNAFVIRVKNKLIFFKNPTIKCYGNKFIHKEKCLSLSGEYKVERYSKVDITDDINGKQTFEGYMACVIQHEYDHIKGILIKNKEIK